MTINEIKRALAEVSKICAENKCSRCPLHKHDGSTVYCPLNTICERVNDPDNWDVDDWEKEASGEPSASERIEDLEARLAQAERERDAVVRDLADAVSMMRGFGRDCKFCKHSSDKTCKSCKWEWRGIVNQKKEEKEKK